MENEAYQFQRKYLQERSEDWPFLNLVQSPNSTINAVYKEIVSNFNEYAQNKKFTYEEYSDSLDEALGILHDLNYWAKNSLGKEDTNKTTSNNMDEYIDNYTEFWFHQECTMEQYLSLQIEFPNNIESLLPYIYDYLECPYLDSQIINWSLVDIIIFKEIKAQSRYMRMMIALTKRGFLSSLFNTTRKKAIVKINKLLAKMDNVYRQCSPSFFHPRIIIELCVDIRKEGDYYDGVLFEILDCMVDNKQYHINSWREKY